MPPAPSTTFLRETANLARNIQAAFWELAKRLCRIKGEELWVGTFASYDDFLEELQISRAMDTKLRTVFLRFKDTVSPGKIAEIGITKLYLIASRCEDSEKAAAFVEVAAQLGRSDLQEAIREDKFGTHECKGNEVTFMICGSCSRWIRIKSK